MVNVEPTCEACKSTPVCIHGGLGIQNPNDQALPGAVVAVIVIAVTLLLVWMVSNEEV